MQPTQVVTPGVAASNQLDLNNRSRILLDDASNIQNPDPIRYPAPGLTATDTLRSGYTLSNLVGVLDYAYGDYRVEPTTILTFTESTNPRTSAPANVNGTLKIASFNVLNYFNGDGLGGGLPTSRGADTTAEFTRQRNKIISARRYQCRHCRLNGNRK